MDVVAVLRDPDSMYDAERIHRFQRRQTIERLILFGLLLVSFLSQLVLHIQMDELRADLNKEKQKVEDIIAAKDIVLNYNRVETYELAKTSDSARSRVQRTVNGATPHFELSGSGGSDGGVFTWNTIEFGDNFRHIQHNGYVKEIQIVHTGMYRIDAEVAINGRDLRSHINRHNIMLDLSPAVCLHLMRKRDNVRKKLRMSCKTQDQRGIERYNIANSRAPSANAKSKRYPFDTISVHGQFLLEANDKIYLQRAPDSLNDPNNERFINDEDTAHFEVFKIV